MSKKDKQPTPYERVGDTFIVPQGNAFTMRDNPAQWYKRAESFDTVQGYVIFGRRMELCLRSVLGADTASREGTATLIRDVFTAPRKFASIRTRLQADIGSILPDAALADCGAGSGSLLGFVEWADLPYPKRLVLLEPADKYYAFLQHRIEGSVYTPTGQRLQVLEKEAHTRHDETEHVVYVVQDAKTGNQSQIQLIHAPAQQKALPLADKTNGLMFMGVSKYYTSGEFKEMVENAQAQLLDDDMGITAFNTQAHTEVIPHLSIMEHLAYRGLKAAHQLKVSGKATLHNFYVTEDIVRFPGQKHIVHNFGNAIIVVLR